MWGNVLAVSYNAKIHIICDLIVIFLGIYLREMKPYICTRTKKVYMDLHGSFICNSQKL